MVILSTGCKVGNREPEYWSCKQLFKMIWWSTLHLTLRSTFLLTFLGGERSISHVFLRIWGMYMYSEWSLLSLTSQSLCTWVSVLEHLDQDTHVSKVCSCEDILGATT
jgi:hypothetical protein